ncbi:MULTISPECIES: hypothetical protein [Rhodanobacteraceae]|uniref:hypothetical protein n=1 Tax=Rhodanobacteraceae TaxID=1775411 RepID=UPI0009A723D3|nr:MULTISPECIES: hypothetical protein [Rhodanobacteraceae]
MSIIPDESVASIVRWAESRPCGVESPTDMRSLPLIACHLCRTINDFLTDDQRLALTAALQYLSVGETVEADRWISCLAQRVGRPYPPHVIQKEVAIERLLWIALNRATNLSGYALDFTLGVAEQAGVSLGDMSNAVQRMVYQRDDSAR